MAWESYVRAFDKFDTQSLIAYPTSGLVAYLLAVLLLSNFGLPSRSVSRERCDAANGYIGDGCGYYLSSRAILKKQSLHACDYNRERESWHSSEEDPSRISGEAFRLLTDWNMESNVILWKGERFCRL